MRRASSLWPLFMISAAAVGLEIALTRYFAVAKWSEYGYWVISIVMAGFALSGVVMALVRDWAVRHGELLLSLLPILLIATGAAGYHFTTTNPFNPLQLQNAATYQPQLANIALYYAVLLPFFFLTGLYVSLAFVLNDHRVGRVYGFDLTGAGAGAALVLGLMALIHPFYLVPALLVPIALAACLRPVHRWAALGAVLALVGGEAVLLIDDEAAFNDFKAIYAPLHVPDSRTLAEIRSPRGLYMLLDDFTERVDTDVSNDAGLLGIGGPPATFGLYRDGNRIAALPKPGAEAVRYGLAALDALPYVLRPNANVLLAGASGGFRVREAVALGARHVDALEPDPILLDALRHGLGGSPAFSPDPIVNLLPDGPLAAVRRSGGYDVIDLSADFLEAAEANVTAFTVEALSADLRALAPGGLLSVPVSIREFPVYAARMLATARQALLANGIADPPLHVVAYRSAWNVRILISNEPFDAARIETVKKFCDDRSFDVSYYPGIDIAAARAKIYNDLPAVSFEDGQVTSGSGPEDAIADEAEAVLRGLSTPSQSAFSLDPMTLDRPAFYAALRLANLGLILRRLEILPQAEIAPLVNLAVLAQAIVLAMLVLAVPLFAGQRIRAGQGGLVRPIVYFAALGLGFLFIEIFLIEKVSLYLNDRTSAFAIVLTAMLVFSGLGSLLAERLSRFGILLPALVIVGWCILMLVGLQAFVLATLDLPWLARATIVLVIIAPVSIALGLPFPLGLARAAQSGNGFLPWAWGLNGAFSVVATPLANLIAIQLGFDRLLLGAALLYIVTLLTTPSARKSLSWQELSVPRPTP